MKKKAIWTVIVIVAHLLGSGVANASSLIQSFEFYDINNASLLFEGFDSVDGNLKSVRLNFTIGVTAAGECIRSIDPYCAIHLRLGLEGDSSPLPWYGTLFTIASVALPNLVDSQPFLGRVTKSFYLYFDDPDDFVDMHSIPIEMSLLYPTDGLVLDRTISSQEVSGDLTYYFVTACDSDFDSDGDTDGKDLAHLSKDFSVDVLDCFAESFGNDTEGTIQAENYDAMSGVHTESTSDAGGGLNVGWIDMNDWMEYGVNFPSSGNYEIEMRVASPYATGQAQILIDGSAKTTSSIPNTGAWQTWTTIKTAAFNVSAGEHTLRIRAAAGGWNINWLKVESAGTGTISVTGVSVSPTSRTLTSVGATVNPNETVSPSNATNKNARYRSNGLTPKTATDHAIVIRVFRPVLGSVSSIISNSHGGR